MYTREFIDAKLEQMTVLLIAKTYDPLSRQVVETLKNYNLNRGRNNVFEVLYIDQRQDVSVIDTYIYQKWLTNDRTAPYLFIRGKYIGGGMELIRMSRSGKLARILMENCLW
ncbi:unnamed protein product [Mesocestoides corti]|uniref:Glutaredoxin domain-containing protein n=1 Tax=Mesocestoides corti TaxID=53468 RepID=A0A0R3UJU5_MESCO|nr:unnamed protein product [Mesocestoides corti]